MERTSRILLKTSREEYCKGGKGVSPFKNPRQRRPGAVSPLEHEVKESCIHPKSSQRAEETVPLNRCTADVVARKREGKNCGVSRSTLHKEKRSGAQGLHYIPEVNPLMHLSRLTAFCQSISTTKIDPVVLFWGTNKSARNLVDMSCRFYAKS